MPTMATGSCDAMLRRPWSGGACAVRGPSARARESTSMVGYCHIQVTGTLQPSRSDKAAASVENFKESRPYWCIGVQRSTTSPDRSISSATRDNRNSARACKSRAARSWGIAAPQRGGRNGADEGGGRRVMGSVAPSVGAGHRTSGGQGAHSRVAVKKAGAGRSRSGWAGAGVVGHRVAHGGNTALRRGEGRRTVRKSEVGGGADSFRSEGRRLRSTSMDSASM